METKITKLRNLMGPIANYFKMKEKGLADFLTDKDLKQSIANMPEILEILKSIPDNAIVEPTNFHLDEIRKDLEELFKSRLISETKIEDFDLRGLKSKFNDEIYVFIIDSEGYFDEDYLDDESDKLIEEIGKKYGVNLSWTDVYGK